MLWTKKISGELGFLGIFHIATTITPALHRCWECMCAIYLPVSHPQFPVPYKQRQTGAFTDVTSEGTRNILLSLLNIARRWGYCLRNPRFIAQPKQTQRSFTCLPHISFLIRLYDILSDSVKCPFYSRFWGDVLSTLRTFVNAVSISNVFDINCWVVEWMWW